jgi:hypothetical protein
MVSLLGHAIDIYAGFTPFSRYRSRRALLYGGATSAMSANAWTTTAHTPVTPGERRRLLSFARIQISYRE